MQELIMKLQNFKQDLRQDGNRQGYALVDEVLRTFEQPLDKMSLHTALDNALRANIRLQSEVNLYEEFEGRVDTAQGKSHNSRIEDATTELREGLEELNNEVNT